MPVTIKEEWLVKIKAIIMDMDGTITQFNLDFMDARRRALEELDRLNLRSADMTEQLPLYRILRTFKESADPATYETLRMKIYGILEQMESKAAGEVMLLPGVLDTLERLRNSSLKIGLLTNNGRKGTELTLNRYDLKRFFDVVVTRDDCEDMKPAPDSVLKVLEALQVSPNEAILIGDGVMDILAARAAGVPSVAVSTGPFTGTRLIEAEPDFLLSSVNDLPMLIETLNADRTVSR